MWPWRPRKNSQCWLRRLHVVEEVRRSVVHIVPKKSRPNALFYCNKQIMRLCHICKKKGSPPPPSRVKTMKSRPGRLAFKVTTTNQGPRTQGVGSEQQDKCRTPSTEKEHTHNKQDTHRCSIILYSIHWRYTSRTQIPCAIFFSLPPTPPTLNQNNIYTSGVLFQPPLLFTLFILCLGKAWHGHGQR